ncbi:unnamed protein product [Effrenium voratum]|nr:unnamed protein product [Effrenium voratum]
MDELHGILVEMETSKATLQHQESMMTMAEVSKKVARLSGLLGCSRFSDSALVGLCVDRNFALVVGLLGILRAGCAFLPLDPGHPVKRLQFVLEDSGAPAVISQPDIGQVFGSREVLLVDDWGELLQLEAPVAFSMVRSERAYVIYTSGSTGRPKGVSVSRRNLHNALCSFRGILGDLSDKRWVAHTTLCFDISLLELLLPLWAGCTLDIADASAAQDGLKARLEPGGVLQATPSAFALLRAGGWAPSGLLLCGGEPFPPWLAKSCGAAEVFNVYGPTEATIWCSSHRVREERQVPIGKPIRNTSLWIDGDGTGKDGVEGELIIGGAGVALGYWNRPELTSARFFESSGHRCFRSGDRVVRKGGELFCLGRLDEQVKLNGFRIELGEIEALLGSEGMQAAVQVRRNLKDIPVLVAYIVSETLETSTLQEVRGLLGQHLPEYMLPQHVVRLQRLPVNPNGKLDRKQLPDPWQSSEESHSLRDDQPADQPASGGQVHWSEASLREMVLHAVAEVTGQELDCEHTGEWRQLGLNSSMAAPFAAILERRLSFRAGFTLNASLMFQHPTVPRLVAALAAFVATSDDSPAPEAAPETAVVRHVVSLGTLCMTAQAMEALGWRRWPGPFDWVFSSPEMVAHCLAEDFASFLEPKHFLATACKKAGHAIYSKMLGRDVIFNHHNPMIPQEYEFLSRCVESLRGLLRPFNGEQSPQDTVLFLLFNLERRAPLNTGILELFDVLRQACHWSYQLVVVKVYTKSMDTPDHRLLQTRCCTQGQLKQELFVYELHAQGSHDGWRFSDEADTQALESLLLAGPRHMRLVSSPPSGRLFACKTPSCPYLSTWLSTHCCFTCAKTKGSKHGDKCELLLDTKRRSPPSAPSLPAQKAAGAVSRAQRFQALLSAPRGALVLQASALRKLRGVLEGPADPSVDCGAWQSLGRPVFADGCKAIWCPKPGDLPAALRLLESTAWAFLLVARSALSGGAGEAGAGDAPAAPAGLAVAFRFKTNMDLLAVEHPDSGILEKLPRTSEEYLLLRRA